MATPSDIEGVWLENASATLLARVVGPDNETPIQQADLSSAQYTAYLLGDHDPDVQTPITGHTDVDVDVSGLIFDELQQDALWGDVDGIGYNFKHVLDVSEYPLFALIGRKYRITFTLTPVSGQVIIVRFRGPCA